MVRFVDRAAQFPDSTKIGIAAYSINGRAFARGGPHGRLERCGTVCPGRFGIVRREQERSRFCFRRLRTLGFRALCPLRAHLRRTGCEEELRGCRRIRPVRRMVSFAALKRSGSVPCGHRMQAVPVPAGWNRRGGNAAPCKTIRARLLRR